LENSKRHDIDDNPIPWHPAFFEAIQLDLEQYKDVLQFISEYQLTSEPLRIDVVIIKKKKDIVIDKNFGAIFRRENLVEYKSPTDYVSVDDFYKVYGYACLYTSHNKCPVTDLTITFVESRYPQALLAHLHNVRGYRVDEKWPGIYYVSGDIIPIQVIDCKKLSSDDSLWLRNLANDLDVARVQDISNEIERQGKAAQIRAYLEAVYTANFKMMTEALQMTDTAITAEEIFETFRLIDKGQELIKTPGEAQFEAWVEAKGRVSAAAIIADRDARIAEAQRRIAELERQLAAR
jgi:hypothetical protein